MLRTHRWEWQCSYPQRTPHLVRWGSTYNLLGHKPGCKEDYKRDVKRNSNWGTVTDNSHKKLQVSLSENVGFPIFRRAGEEKHEQRYGSLKAQSMFREWQQSCS